MHKYLIPILILSTLTACDEPAAETCPASAHLSIVAPADAPELDITFREQGPPQGLYTPKLGGGSIDRAGFIKLITACADQQDPPLTVTLSWYQPDLTKDSRVLGLGVSMLAGTQLLDCWETIMIANNATPF